MIALVLVSHSQKLAEGTLELARQMGGNKVPIALAGGLDDPDNPIGTEPFKIMEAIQKVYTDNGVLVFMDIGSAIMSTETAIEMLEAAQQEHIRLSEAPLVEGALAAAAQAMAGGNLQECEREALNAYKQKARQINPDAATSDAPVAEKPETTGENAQSFTLAMPNPHGLHARPATRLIALIKQFNVNAQLTYKKRTVPATSMSQVATLGVRQGEEVRFDLSGPDSEVLKEAIQALAEDYFGDSPQAQVSANETEKLPEEGENEHKQYSFKGAPISGGTAVAPLFIWRKTQQEVPKHASQEPEKEIRHLKQVLEEEHASIQNRANNLERHAGKTSADILRAQALLLEDEDWLEGIQKAIKETHKNAAHAWCKAIETLAGQYEAMEDTYMQERASDIRDLGGRVLTALTGTQKKPRLPEQPFILIAEALEPSDTAELSPQLVRGIITQTGGATGHAAILARAMGIPAITQVRINQRNLQDQELIAMDATQGMVWLAGDYPGKVKQMEEQAQKEQKQREIFKQQALKPASTLDDYHVPVLANIGSKADVNTALSFGAEGSGLFRTEFMYMNRQTSPDEEEQVRIYSEVARAFGKAPLTIRTMDIGGDKPVPHLDMPHEANPFLGYRGIRYCLDNPEFFKTQLRALWRAANDGNVRVMFPMISTPEEWKQAQKLLQQARQEVQERGIALPGHLPVGIMVEVPSIIFMLEHILPELDFISIGTNDLTQYLLARDRENNRVSKLASPFHPAVLRSIAQSIELAHQANVQVDMCGEMAGNPQAIPILLALGLDEFSMNAAAIPKAKAHIRQLHMGRERKKHRQWLNLPDLKAVMQAAESLEQEITQQE